MQIQLAKDTISNADLDELADWIKTHPRLTKGPLTDQFETEFAKLIGSKYAVCVNSGSSANLIAAAALKYSDNLKNNKVIVPAVSWVTTVSPFMQLGYEVIVCDCDPLTLGLDVGHFEKLCEQYRPGSAILVHVLGHNSSIRQIMEICSRYDVKLIEDSCEALGSKTSDRFLGTDGVFGTYSFYYGHHISTIEGGMIVTNDHELAQIARSLRAHGWVRDADPEFRERLESKYEIDSFRSFYSFYYPGFNCRPTDLNAFLGIRQLALVENVSAVRQSNFNTYAKNLDKFWKQESDCELVSSFAYGTFVKNRLEVAEHLFANEIEVRPLICGSVARQPFMQDMADLEQLPVSNLVHDHGLYLPNHAMLTTEEIDYVCEKFVEIAQPLFPSTPER